MTYRLCKRFTVESGHMLSKHPGRCRFPHGHTRTIEVVVACQALDSMDMVLDFKALKLALRDTIRAYDHALVMNSQDPFLPSVQAMHPDAVVIYESEDPTTEVMARRIFEEATSILASGWRGAEDGISYQIDAGRVWLERIRVWETPTSWAEVGV
ncbi:MAG TPA: 6-carboxytetrahydropterin synthase [Fimbriimonadaceae bacterium]|nr:6-carboxytetrahydropterin synthase [Fimbriimonadaceae bacterium]HRJ32694.1 6-carboxytetrahydropterin synthase [Fimbriimonadaceae bacterium]